MFSVYFQYIVVFQDWKVTLRTHLKRTLGWPTSEEKSVGFAGRCIPENSKSVGTLSEQVQNVKRGVEPEFSIVFPEF